MTSTHSRIPPILAPYIHTPRASSLYLITSVLGASANWLLLRYLVAALAPQPTLYGSARDNALAYEQGQEDVAVVLVSFTQDLNFWRTEAKRAGGLDLAALQTKGRFAYVDALGFALSSASLPPAVPTSTEHVERPLQPSQTVPFRDTARPTTPSRILETATTHPPPHHPIAQSLASPQASAPSVSVQANTHDEIQSAVLTALNSLKQLGRRTLLILDTPTTLLYTAPALQTSQEGEQDPCLALMHMLLSLRAHAHSTILHVPADNPFVAASPSSAAGEETRAHTPLEISTAAFTLAVAHQSSCILSCRRLDTGRARDVSGVLRVSRGGGAWDEDEDVHEGEWLYHVRGDGVVKVWSRGAVDTF